MAVDSASRRQQRIFISYRRDDSAGHAGRLEEDLQRALGERRVFMDLSDIGAGADFEQALDTELAGCGAVLALIGPRWAASFESRHGDHAVDYVRLELQAALAANGPRVIPVLVGGVTALPAAMPAGLEPLAKRQALVLRDDRWQDDVAHLAAQLRAALKLRRWPIAALAALLLPIAAAAWWFAGRPSAPADFSRERAHEVTIAAARKAAAACQPKAVEGACPLAFRFAPNGAATQVWFDAGYCPLKAPPFGDCVLGRLAGVKVPPFDNVDAAEVLLELSVDGQGAVKAIAEQ